MKTVFRKKTLGLAVAAGVSSTLLGGTAQAQLEEVLVTAQKRAQNTQDIGISIATVGSQDLEQLGIMNAGEIAQYVPNVELANSGDSGIPIFVIRAVGLQDYNANNTPTTGMFVDDVYLPYGIYGSFALFDADRVEILKGPQGGLYGRNTTGGAINFVSRTPSFEQVEGNIAVDAGNYDTFNLRGGISTPIGENMGIRLGIQHQQSEGYYDNEYLDTDQGGVDKSQVRLTFAFEPTDTFRGAVRLTYGRDKSELGIPEILPTLDPTVQLTDEQLGLALGFGGPVGLPDMNQPLNPDLTQAFCPQFVATGLPSSDCINMQLQGADGDPYKGVDDKVYEVDDEYKAAAVNLEWDIGNLTIISISAVANMKFLHPQGDGHVGIGQDNAEQWALTGETLGRFNNGALDPTIIQEYGSEVDSWSQEFRVLSNYDDDFNWMAGIVYAEDDFEENRFTTFPGNLFWDYVFFPGGGDMNYEQETEALSVYGQIIWNIGDAWRLTVDGRVTQEKKDYFGDLVINDGAWTCFLFGVPDAECAEIIGDEGTYPFSGAETDYDETNESWKVNLDWTPNDDWLIYGSIGHGFKSGGFFGGFMTDPRQVTAYEPETNTAYELGFKSTLLDGTLQFNSAIFFYDYEDWQSVISVLGEGGAGFAGLANVGDVEVTGAEFDLRWAPVTGLDLRLGAGWLDTEIKSVDLPTFSGEDLAVGIVNEYDEFVDVTGNEIPNAPELTVNALARYDFSIGSLGAALQVDAAYTDSRYITSQTAISEARIDYEDSQTIWNARAEIYSDGDSNWNVAVWGRNLGDEEVRIANWQDGLFNRFSEYGAPRTYGVTLGYNF